MSEPSAPARGLRDAIRKILKNEQLVEEVKAEVEVEVEDEDEV